MTKSSLAEQILQCTENISEREDQLEAIISLLDTLEPKDKVNFAKWGFPDQKGEPETCWAI